MRGPLIIDLAGLQVASDEIPLLEHPLVGGVILFSRNYENRAQLRALTTAIRNIAPELLLMVDQEGGRVQRFIHEFTKLPALHQLGELYETDMTEALLTAEQAGFLMAAEVLAVGLDLSLAPVLDINYGISTVIGKRSFHQAHDAIILLATAYIQGMHRAGMQAVGKHFPGHGAVVADSHLELPVDNRNLTAIEKDYQLYLPLIQSDLLAGVMPAHVLYPKIDARLPAFSPYWLQTVLREQLNFSGVIMSDDLSMSGAHCIPDPVLRVQTALRCGCDMVLLCNARNHVLRVLAEVNLSDVLLKAPRLQCLRPKPTQHQNDDFFVSHARHEAIISLQAMQLA